MVEKQTLLSKTNFEEEDIRIYSKELQELTQHKNKLERQLGVVSNEIDQFRRGTITTSRDSAHLSKESADKQEIKRLMEQNERLVQELNELRKLKLQHPVNPDVYKNAEGKDVFLVIEKSKELSCRRVKENMSWTRRTEKKKLK